MSALALAPALRAGNSTVPGEISTPYPTIVNLSVEWRIEGDDNENGQVGDGTRTDALLPLLVVMR